ncbi:MAG: V-type ATPase 116kDa subunit family protein, partial [Nanoarchaeota archaeon]
MFTTERMMKIRITGSQTQLSSVVELLYSLQLMHLVDHKKTEALDIGSPLADSEKISALLLQIRSLLAAFPATVLASIQSQQGQKKSISFDHIQHEFPFLATPLAAAQQRLTSLQSTITEKKQVSNHLQLLAALHLSPDALTPYKSLASFIGTVSSDQQLSSSLLAVAPDAYVRIALHDNLYFVAVFVSHNHAAAVQDVLQKYSYKQYPFSDLSSFSHDPAVEAKKLLVTVGLLEKDLAHAEKKILQLQTTHALSLVAMESFLAAALAKAQAPLRFAETKHAFFIEGWVSAQEYQLLKQGLEKETHHKIHLEVLEIMKSDKIPIVLKNSFFVKPFEFFLHLYTLPSYKEMDPSFFIFFSFPFFFGLMLGDV